MASTVVIVESPTKAKTLRKFLGRDFEILASVGHVIDLPQSKLGVDLDQNFEPHYITIRGKEKILKELKKAAKKASSVLLATDPDREGEAISWHLSRALQIPPEKATRVLIPEFTKSVVQKAIATPVPLDLDKVNSQQARRVLDRIVGYKISPLLWKKVQSGLSAGRVQSVALKLISEREKEIQAFVAEEFWTLSVDLKARDLLTGGSLSDVVEARRFQADLKTVDGKNHTIRSRDEMDRVLAELATAGFSISKIASVRKHQRPHAPFITSTLQQSASQVFSFSTKKTMMIAQQLYEGIELGRGKIQGLITYMRTDSTRVSPEAQAIVRAYITGTLGPQYLPPSPPIYQSAKGKVQDAHEAIRPSDVNLDPKDLKAHLSPDQYKLYSLVWTRFLASQMAPAEFMQKTVDVEAGRYSFRAVGREKLFDGYLKIHETHSIVSKKVKETLLPPLKEKEALDKLEEKAEQGFTQPPPHYTEAGLVKTLEENGIGRPSTYATIISTLLDRGYVERAQKNLIPTELGMLVVDLLQTNFKRIMDVEFTAALEEELDEIEKGKFRWQEVLGRFYADFKEALAIAEKQMKDLKKEVVPTGESCNLCGKPMVIRRGRFGKFVACSGFPDCRNTRELPKDGQPASAAAEAPKLLDEKCEKCGSQMQLRKGRFGQFKACSNYPTCKNTKAILTKLGVPCPEKDCKGEIVSRFSRSRRVFYGCSEYPTCKFTSWVRLAKGTCPDCQSYLVEKRSKNVLQAIACSRKGCGWSKAPDPGADGETQTGLEPPPSEAAATVTMPEADT